MRVMLQAARRSGARPGVDLKDLDLYVEGVPHAIFADVVEVSRQPELFFSAIRHRGEGRFSMDKPITAYPFFAINEAIADQAKGACCKAALAF